MASATFVAARLDGVSLTFESKSKICRADKSFCDLTARVSSCYLLICNACYCLANVLTQFNTENTYHINLLFK